jgi:pimeloyl-ACP methyl ester carboxylesterase
VIWAFLFAGAVLALPVLAEAARRPMNAAWRARAPGEIAHLPGGDTHYRCTGPEDGPAAVLIHGLSTPSYVFAATERSLAALGYRVLVYDLYGRGYSARPRGRQDRAFFVRQLRALLKHREVAGPLTVAGFSMGAAIATAFAAEEENIAALVLVAPAGLVPSEPSVWTWPVVGDWLTRVAGGWRLRRELVEHRTTPTVVPDLEDRQAAETRVRGYLPALLSSRRHLLAVAADGDHRRVAAAEVPVLAVWGTEDPVIPRRAMGRLAELNPDARHVEVRGAGHNLLQTHPVEVAAALKEFLA